MGTVRRPAGARGALGELAGGLGDTGLFIPIAVAMITLNGLNATAVFVVTGLVYVGTALYFRVPVPVQPLKAFAAAAIALHLSAETLAAGALLMAAAMAVLSAWGLAELAGRALPGRPRSRHPGQRRAAPRQGRGRPRRKGELARPAADRRRRSALRWPLPPAPFSSPAGGSRCRAACSCSAAGAAVGLAVGGLPGPARRAAGGLALGPGWRAPSRSPSPRWCSPSFRSPSATPSSRPPTPSAATSAAVPAGCDPARLAASIGVANTLAGLSGGAAALPRRRRRHRPLQARRPDGGCSTLAAGLLFVALGLGLGSSLPALLQVLAPGALAGMLAFVAIQHGMLAGQLERLDDRLIAGRRRSRPPC